MNKNEDLDSDFLWEVTKDGIVLYAHSERILSQKENLQPSISHNFSDMPAKDKMYVKRKIYGYQVKSVIKGKNI